MINTESEKIELDDNLTLAIEVLDLKKYFKAKPEIIKAVDGVSFSIKKGEIFGLLGTNGAGKTTIINMLTGVTSPTGGEAFIDGYDIAKDLHHVKQIMSVCPQEPAVYKFMSAMANIKAEELMKVLGIYEYRNRLVKNYSGGMLRQLSLIISLISDPEILFLDEPTVGMDPRNRRKVWTFLNDVKTKHKTIILTTHYIEEAEALCDRVAIIDYGKVIALGKPRDLIEEHHVDDLEQVFMKITGRKITEGMF